MTWKNYYPYILNRKEVFHLTLFHSLRGKPPARLRFSQAPDAPCQPRGKVTSHTTIAHYLNLIFNFGGHFRGFHNRVK